MAKSINEVVILGNLVRDPELRTTQNGASVCTFTVALNRNVKVNDEWSEEVTYVDCVAWADLAEKITGNLEKGKPVSVVGRLKSSTWEQDGRKRSKLEVIVNQIVFLERPQKLDSMPHKDVPLEDISDEPINLSEIPF